MVICIAFCTVYVVFYNLLVLFILMSHMRFTYWLKSFHTYCRHWHNIILWRWCLVTNAFKDNFWEIITLHEIYVSNLTLLSDSVFGRNTEICKVGQEALCAKEPIFISKMCYNLTTCIIKFYNFHWLYSRTLLKSGRERKREGWSRKKRTEGPTTNMSPSLFDSKLRPWLWHNRALRKNCSVSVYMLQ